MENLDPEVIVAIIGIIGTLSSAVIAFFVNQRNRKNAALRDIICTERLKTLDNFKRTYFKLYELFKKYSLKKEILNEDFYSELISSSAEFECVIKTFYSIEKEIYNVEQELVDSILNSKETNGEFNEKLDSFYKLCQVYEWSYWKYIQVLAVKGKYLNSDEDFDKIYYELKNKNI